MTSMSSATEKSRAKSKSPGRRFRKLVLWGLWGSGVQGSTNPGGLTNTRA